MLSLGQHSLGEVIPCEFYLGFKGRDYLCALADPHDDLDGAAGEAESEKLLESDRMDVFGLVEGDEEEKGEFGERSGFEDRIFFEDFGGKIVFALQDFCLEEEVNEVAEGKQSCSSCKSYYPSRLCRLKLESSSSWTAQLYIIDLECSDLQSRGHLAISINLEHDRQVMFLLTFLLPQQPFLHVRLLALHLRHLRISLAALFDGLALEDIGTSQLGYQFQHETHVAIVEEVDRRVKSGQLIVDCEGIVLS